MANYNVSLGKSYVRVQALYEIDMDTGMTKILDYVAYPVKNDNWQYQKHQKKVKKDTPIKNSIEKIKMQETLF